MVRTYEYTFIADPRLSEEEAVKMADDYKAMITSAGGTVIKEESWGKRRLAYPIQKLNEGRYFLLYINAEDTNPLREVEHRMNQNDKILRFLTVRTDRPQDALESATETDEESSAAGEEE